MEIDKRYVRDTVLWILAFIITLQAAGQLADMLKRASLWPELALLPIMLALAGGMWIELRQIRRLDELQRSIYLVATLSGSMSVLALVSIAYVGEVLVGWSRLSPVFYLGAMGAGFLIGWVVASRRYR